MGTKGKLIAFEGVDGVGKTYQIARLEQYLTARNQKVLRTLEPGGTTVGAALRDLLLNRETGELDPICELLLFAADRRQHMTQVLRPALADGKIVLTDRYLYSSVAYQGYGRGVDTKTVDALNALSTGGLMPDLTIILDLDRKQAQTRLAAGRKGKTDRMEQEAELFYNRVRQGFAAIAQQHPQTVCLIDGNQDRDAVAADVVRAVTALGL